MLNILIVKLSAIGDVIHCLPVAAALKQNLPDARISWLVEAGSADLLIGNPCVDEVIIFRAKSWLKGAGNPVSWLKSGQEAAAFFADLRSRHFDVALEMQGLLKSSLLAFASGAKMRIGFAETREFSDRFLTNKVEVGDYFGHYVPVVELNLKIAEALLAVLGKSSPELAPKFSLPRPNQSAIDKVVHLLAFDNIQNDVYALKAQTPGGEAGDTGIDIHIRNRKNGEPPFAPGAELVPPEPSVPQMMQQAVVAESGLDKGVKPRLCAIIPGTTWVTKIWPADKWLGLCRLLVDRLGYRLVLIGAKSEQEINSHLANQLKSVTDLTGKTSLLDLIALFELCDLVIGGDTGPLHLAAAVSQPKILGIYGSTPWRRNGPYGEHCRSVSLETWCQPCYAKNCALKTVACLNELSVEQVFEAICSFTGSTASSGNTGNSGRL